MGPSETDRPETDRLDRPLAAQPAIIIAEFLASAAGGRPRPGAWPMVEVFTTAEQLLLLPLLVLPALLLFLLLRDPDSSRHTKFL